MTTKLEVETLRTCTIVRPANTCGTCGWHPKAWTLAVIDRRKRHDPIGAFLAANKLWTRQDVML